MIPVSVPLPKIAPHVTRRKLLEGPGRARLSGSVPPGLATPAYSRAQGSHSHPGLCSWTVHTPKGRQRAVTPYPHLLGSVTCFLGPTSWWQAFPVCLWQTMPQSTAERLSFCTPPLRLCPLLGPRTNRWVSGQGPSGLHGQPRVDTWLPLGESPSVTQRLGGEAGGRYRLTQATRSPHL